MNSTISIGKLRQNPTRMLREVRAGATYTITDHGEPVAEITGLRRPQWVSVSVVNEVLQNVGADDRWACDIAADRAAESPTDPWERPE